MRKVSVPLRGLWFLSNDDDIDYLAQKEEEVSVPLRGLWFLSSINTNVQESPRFCFRPLAGIMVLIFYIRLSRYRQGRRRCFRPLAGIMVLIAITAIRLVYTLISRSFRPLAGIMVLIKFLQEKKSAELALFPSPCGDYGSYQLLIPCHTLFRMQFPSPCGDYGSYHISDSTATKILNLFPSPCGDYGSYRIHFSRRCSRLAQWFPSPCGDYGSYQVGTVGDYRVTWKSFRPLAGIMVLINRHY